jgi:hypothetical protein
MAATSSVFRENGVLVKMSRHLVKALQGRSVIKTGGSVKNLMLNPPTLAFVVSTRAALAAGVGLLVAGRLSDDRRRTLGKALVAIGAATTIPAVMAIRRGFRRARSSGSPVGRDKRMIGATRFPRKGDDIY